MNILKDFELCGNNQKVPFISVMKMGFIIGEETRRLLGDPAYIRVWRRKETRQILHGTVREGNPPRSRPVRIRRSDADAPFPRKRKYR